ncbi:hypothetical protein [Clostridium beijerinckii]|uniref:hypothetical protein n=1 Tax=Clostridium beijerinckii TaxID=1520 RepID=UPI0012D2ED70|nr:hypothetical protein [Clostridium beijerinckii]
MATIYLSIIAYIFACTFHHYQKSYLTSDKFFFLILVFPGLNYNENEYISHALA